MAISIIDGFKIYVNGKRSMIIDSDRLDKCMEAYAEHQLDGVAVTTAHGYKLQNVDFLAAYPDIKHVSISDGIRDISAIHSLKKLESLIISGKNKRIDFLNFPFLKELRGEWSPQFFNLDNCRHLQSLALYHYNPKSKDCMGVAGVPWIKKLSITQSPIVSLNGLDEFGQLEELELNYCSKLETLCCLEESKSTLASLRFDHCKSIRNHDYVIQLDNLNTLAYNHGGNIPSIKFIKRMISLRDFMFVGTDIGDGDMTPCIGLDYAAFSNKRHFSHTMEQIKSLSETSQGTKDS